MTTVNTKVGRYTVVDPTRGVHVDSEGNELMSLKEALGYERRAACVVFSDAAKIGPAEMRFARKALALKQTDLARFLGVNACTVSDWESSKSRITKQTQLAVLALLQQAARGPVWPPEAWLTVKRQSEHPPAASETFVIQKRKRVA